MPYTGSRVTKQSSEGDIDQANQYMRSQPWYQDYLRSIGQTGAVRLSGDQRKQLERLVMQNMAVDEGGLNIDHSGNIDKVGHKLRNTLIAAGLGAGAAFAAPAIAGLIGGGGAAGGGAAASAAGAGTAGAAGVLPSTVIGSGMMPAIAGGTGIGAGAAGAGGAITGGSILGRIGSSILPNARGIGAAIGAASSAAGNTRRADTDTNVGAQSAFNQALMGRAALEQQQRNSALRDVYAAGYFRDQPRSPYNPAPVRGVSQNYLQALGGLEQQGMSRLAQAPQYGTNQMPQLRSYATRPGILERIGNYAGPVMSIIGAGQNRNPYPGGTPPFV